jgi:hypothetical protein
VRVSCVLGPLKGFLRSPQEHSGVVLGAQLDEAGVGPDAVVPVVDTAAQGEPKTAVEALGARLPGLGSTRDGGAR